MGTTAETRSKAFSCQLNGCADRTGKMSPGETAEVDAIRMAWGIGISQAEADSAACVIQERRLLRPDLPESYWARALRNLMLDYARHSKERKHAVLHILYPRRTGRGNYVEDALIEAIDASRRDRRRQQIQIENILAEILKVAGHVEHVNTTPLSHDAFIARLLTHRKLSTIRLRSTLRFTNPTSGGTLLTVHISSYFSWPADRHDTIIRRSAVSLLAAADISALPPTIHCRIEKDAVNEGGLSWEL